MKRWLSGAWLIFLVFGFQVTNISHIHMHPDEEPSYRATRYGLDHVFYYQQSRRDNHSPLWFLAFWTWHEIVGDAEFTSRIMGALTSVLTLAITYRVGRCWFGNAVALGAQSDGEILHYGMKTVPTLRLQAGRLYIDFRSIALSPDLPAGEYKQLTLVAYQSWDGVRLTLPNGDDRLVLETIILD